MVELTRLGTHFVIRVCVALIKYRHSLFDDVYEQSVPTGTLVISIATALVSSHESDEWPRLSTVAQIRDVADERPPRKKT